MVEIFVARQPILTKNDEVFGYELLYRNNNEQNKFVKIDGDQATSSVINSLVQIGVDELSEQKPCFINFTEALLENIVPSLFQPKTMVVEILETVTPTDKIIDNCIKLKEKGYKIALDDFDMEFGNENVAKLISLSDIIKIDIQKTPRKEQLKIIHTLKRFNLEFLAEKVETKAEYEQCLQDGFVYFQGYYFSKPTILSTNDVPVQNQNFLLIMSELNQPEPHIDKLAKIIEGDISLSFKLLRLLNSPALGLVYTIRSIKQAIVLLGLIELEKWVYVLSIQETSIHGNEVPNEIIKMSFTRAKASELVAKNIGRSSDSSSYFLTGLLTLIEAIFKLPLEKLTKELPLDQEIKDTLFEKKTTYSDVINLVIAAEQVNWDEISRLTQEVGLENDNFFEIYQQAIKWSKELL